MTKVSVLYANGEGKTFDMDYYCNKHLAIVGNLLGDALKGATVEQGLNSDAPFAAMGNMYFESPEAFEQAFGPHAEEIMGDLPNFTNIEPKIQVSKVLI